MMIKSSILSTLLVAIVAVAPAQQLQRNTGISTEDRPGIRISVLERGTNTPLKGVDLVIINGKDSTRMITDKDGTAHYDRLPKHPKLIFKATYPGYATKVDSTILQSISPTMRGAYYLRLEKEDK